MLKAEEAKRSSHVNLFNYLLYALHVHLKVGDGQQIYEMKGKEIQLLCVRGGGTVFILIVQ